MKQVVLNPRSGRVSLVDTPPPAPAPDRILVATEYSLISPGTERQMIELSGRSLVGKARARPDAARQVIGTLKKEGLRSAVWKAKARLEHPFALGYSVAGTVLQLGRLLSAPAPGTRVACTGAEIATHAEVVSVPPLLAVPVPEGVTQEEAAFASLGATAMHAIRLSGVQPGGTAAVIGLGLLGQLAAQILTSTGVWTLGIEPNAFRRELAASLSRTRVSAGGEEAISTCMGRGGADTVIVAVSGGGPDILRSAIEMARDRGRIVLISALPLSLDRDAMYRKELSLVVARSSGAGKYDRTYEQEGVDLPVGYVRWTEARNMAAFLELIGDGRLSVRGLITHRFEVQDAEAAYEVLERGSEPNLGILLCYRTSAQESSPREIVLAQPSTPTAGRPRIGVVGAGTFARATLLPHLKRLPIDLTAIATARGSSSAGTAKRFGISRATTDPSSVTSGDDVDAVLIATRHDLHAAFAVEALRSGRSVYVEKPLSLNREELLEICEAWAVSRRVLSVGFNRRWAPLVRRLRSILSGTGPVVASYVVNAPHIAGDSWILDSAQGGGVVLAEGGHFVDTLAFLIGSPPREVSGTRIDRTSYVATIRFADGSVGSVAYTTSGEARGPKELLTVAGRGVLAELRDFRSLSFWTGHRRRTVRRRRQDKGHAAALEAWVNSIATGSPSPVGLTEIVAVTEATICLDEAVRTAEVIHIDLSRYMEALAPSTA